MGIAITCLDPNDVALLYNNKIEEIGEVSRDFFMERQVNSGRSRHPAL